MMTPTKQTAVMSQGALPKEGIRVVAVKEENAPETRLTVTPGPLAFACADCGFTAKSEHGLKIHKASHK